MNLECSDNGCLHVISLRIFCIIDVDGVATSRHVENRSVIEVRGELLSIEGGRRDEQFEVGSVSGYIFNQSKQDIRVQRPLVSLINHQHRVRLEVGLAQKLSQQHAIRHVLQNCPVTGTVFKADRVSNLMT